ncbi:MAG: hypothetical protein NVS1B13_03080 [Flavisolibacter sp.]
MASNNREIKAREKWLLTYQELGSVNKAALKCGVPRSTIYRWIKRYKKRRFRRIKGSFKTSYEVCQA